MQKMAKMIKIVFVGGADWAGAILQQLLISPICQVVAVYTKPDRPKGRGLKITPSAVKQLAEGYQLPLVQPNNLRDPAVLQQMAAWQADALVNVACGFLLPPVVLNMFPQGCINVHPSLLPRWRGAAPIVRALMADDAVTGVSIMQMDEGLDTGPIYIQQSIPITDQDDDASLTGRLTALGGTLLLQVLADLVAGRTTLTAQDSDRTEPVYANKIDKNDRIIDWHRSARQIFCQARALRGGQTAYTLLNGQQWLIHEVALEPAKLESPLSSSSDQQPIPGQILTIQPTGIAIQVGAGAPELLWITRAKPAGGRILTAQDLYNAYRSVWQPGMVLG